MNCHYVDCMQPRTQSRVGTIHEAAFLLAFDGNGREFWPVCAETKRELESWIKPELVVWFDATPEGVLEATICGFTPRSGRKRQ